MNDRRGISIVLIATGPERIVAGALDSVLSQTAADLDIVLVCEDGRGALADRLVRALTAHHQVQPVAAGVATPGVLRNAAVRESRGRYVVVIDGGEDLPPDYLACASAVLDEAPAAAYAAAPGDYGPPHPASQIDMALLLAGPWSVAAPLIRRTALERVGGFDELLPDLVQWDLLLTLAELGESGILLRSGTIRRPRTGDVRLRESLRAERHLPAVRRVFARHRSSFDAEAARLLVDRERIARALWFAERELLDRRDRVQAELVTVMSELATVQAELGQEGRTLEWADLRRTTPFSRNWGTDRGKPIDRHYIEAFLAEHAGDVRGTVLEMLDPGLTSIHGGDRVERSDVLDIDPTNDRATIVADLRAPHVVPSDTYDCFILTQTLHLIDDMAAAVEHAHRVLKPGGVLLATLPCVSMVAEEYGAGGDHWRVTEAGARRLFERHFAPGALTIEARGNVLASTAFLYGLACHEVDPQELEVNDPAYPLIVTVRAVKSSAGAATRQARAPARAAVLLYHRIAPLSQDRHRMAVAPDAFRSQLEYLCRKWRPTRLSELAAAALAGDIPDRALALTFDDGYLDNLEVAAPLLTELGVPATFFVTSEALRRPHGFWWDRLEQAFLDGTAMPSTIGLEIDGAVRTLRTADDDERRASHDELYAILKGSLPVIRDDLLWQLVRGGVENTTPDRARAMVAGELRQLAAVPHVEIGAHGVHHVALPGLEPEHLFREVSECRTAIERVVDRPVTLFAYPFGACSPESLAMVRAAGYRFAFTCEERRLRPGDHPLRLPRIGAPHSAAALETLLAGI